MYKILKRCLDVTGSFIALAILLPVNILIAFIVIVSSRGGVFFLQERVGFGGRIFKLVKFRTMISGASSKGPLITSRSDRRITKVGYLLRRTKLDELPELWNVLIGDMSLVGPRPEVPIYLKYYSDKWMKVLSIKPGITDFATLQFIDEESILDVAKDWEKAYIKIILPTKLELGVDYVCRMSLILDLKILLLTIWGITFGRFFAKTDRTLAERVAIDINRLNKE